MGVVFTNNAETTLAAAITSTSATSISVTSSSTFPTVGAGEYFYATISDGSNLEIVKVTAVSGTTWTVVRASDDTTARTFANGSSVQLRTTAALLTDIQENIASKSANQTVYNATAASSATAYDIGINPGVEANAMVFLDGVMQHHDTFSFSGSTLTFDAAPVNGTKIEVIVDNLINLQSSNLTVDTFTATSGQTAFTLSDSPAAESNLIVFINGVFQNQDAYTISNNTLTLDTGVVSGRTVTVYVINPVNIGTPSDGTVTSAKLSGNITMPGTLTVGSNDVAFDSPTFVVDHSNSRVGLGTASPTVPVDIVGDVKMSANLTVDTSTLKVDSSNNRVGIGTSSPSTTLEVNNTSAGATVATFEGDYSASGDVKLASFERNGGAVAAAIEYNDATTDMELGTTTSHNFSLKTADTRRLTIDTSGNMMVGTTQNIANTDANDTGGSAAFFGMSASQTGTGVHISSRRAASLVLNRMANDGDIITLNTLGATVGNIGVSGGNNIYISGSQTNHAGLTFATDAILPTRQGSTITSVTDLGATSERFKHLYFSGGLYGGSEVQLSNLGLGTVEASASIGHTASENEGVFWHTTKTDYGIYRTSGAWSGTYSQLKLDWDTGIYIDGGTSYGASGVHISEKVSLGDSSYSNFGSPNYQVHIVGDGTALAIESGTGEAYIGSQNTSYFHFLGNRNFYFGNRCEANGGFHTYSDENLKKEITPITGALNNVAKMNGVTFKWKDAEKRGGGDTGKQFGVTAQNMLEVDSELPTLNKDPLASQDEIDNKESTDYYTMDYNRITPFLIEAVKELKTKLEAAETRITELEK